MNPFARLTLSALLATGFLLALGSTPAIPEESTQVEELPDAHELWNRAIEASGGEEALAKIGARHMTGRVEIPSQEIKGTLETFAVAPDRIFVRVEIAGIGEILTGYDGEVGWMIHPAFGAQILEGLALDQLRHQASFRYPLHPDEFAESMETEAVEEFDGRPCHRVRIVTKWEEEYTQYFDVETGFVAGFERKQASPMGEIPTTTALREYQKVGDVVLPVKTVQVALQTEQVIYADNISTDPVDETVFELPKEIKALLD